MELDTLPGTLIITSRGEPMELVVDLPIGRAIPRMVFR
jgi:hypothetical protein